MNDDKSKQIFNIRAQIQKNKAVGYTVQPLTYLGQPAVRIICKATKVNFSIDPESLADLKRSWYATKLSRFISFYDWLLQNEV